MDNFQIQTIRMQIQMMKIMDQKMILPLMNKVTKSSFLKNRKKERRKGKILRLLNRINKYLNHRKKMDKASNIPKLYIVQQTT